MRKCHHVFTQDVASDLLVKPNHVLGRIALASAGVQQLGMGQQDRVQHMEGFESM